MPKSFILHKRNGTISPRNSVADVSSLRQIAEKRLRLLNARKKYVPESLLRDTAWNMLLDLYVHQKTQEGISIGSACIASGSPHTTALRWINILEEESLLQRIADANDKRRHLLSLTPKGRKAIEDWLSEE